MKKILLLSIVASLALGSTLLYAREDHRAYRPLKFDACNECHRGNNVTPNHQAYWNVEHRLIAVKSEAPCADCHDQSWCQDCHYGGGIDRDLHTSNDRGPNYKPKSHRTSFIEVHPIFVFDNPNSCTRCHQPSFCAECHQRFAPEQLMVLSHRRGWSDLPAAAGGPRHSTFPPDSCQACHVLGSSVALPRRVWTADHAQEARRNLTTCQMCHADGETCLRCHSARQGLRINPHPDDWGKIQNRLNRAAGQRTCVKCH